MIVTHKLKIDLVRQGVTEVVYAVQTDTYCRDLQITVTAGGQAVEFPEGVSVRGSYRKADGTRGIYDTMPDGQTAAGSVAGNVVTLSLAPQLLTAAGTAELAVQLISGETLLNVFPIQVNVAALPGFNGKSENYYSISGLPQITEADNGKVLQVVDGMWVAGTAVAGSGGTVSAIDFTNFDYGSYTEVVNGKEVSHSVTFDDSGRPATVDGVTLEWPEEEEDASPVGVTLPVVEISDRTALTDAEKARLNEVVNEPYILLAINAVPIVMGRLVEDDIIGFVGAIGTQRVGIILMDGAWLVSVDTFEGI